MVDITTMKGLARKSRLAREEQLQAAFVAGFEAGELRCASCDQFIRPGELRCASCDQFIRPGELRCASCDSAQRRGTDRNRG